MKKQWKIFAVSLCCACSVSGEPSPAYVPTAFTVPDVIVQDVSTVSSDTNETSAGTTDTKKSDASQQPDLQPADVITKNDQAPDITEEVAASTSSNDTTKIDAPAPDTKIVASCVDKDKDGFGLGCATGPDCDDNNPNFVTVCPNCAVNNYEGCPCQGVAVNCYSGEAQWVGKGVCQSGVQLCKSGYWSECKGEILPSPEVCDAKDNNCNGLIDEGVLSTCGTCDTSCTLQNHGPDYGDPFDSTPDSSNGVGINKNGYLELDISKANVDLNHIWIAGTAAKVVSKLNTKTGQEVGRYVSCSSPSRTSVDLSGDVWVGCRSGGEVMKIINKTQDCLDKNGNGKIETSAGKNVLPYGQDECVKFVVKPSPNESIIRAAGVDKDNYAWVGGWNTKTLWRLHPVTGAVVDTVSIGCNPYGLVIDQKGIIWISGRGCSSLVRVDPAIKKITNVGHGGKGSPYGINVDMFGRIWIANTTDYTSRYDPITGQWAAVQHNQRSRGVATSNDGHVYVALDTTSSIAKINVITLTTVAHIALGSGRFPVGIAVDYDGYIWAVNQQKSTTSKIDPNTHKVVGEYPVGTGPYTYSDMTGYSLNNYTAPKGHYTHIFGFSDWSGTISETKTTTVWEAINVDASIPEKALLKFRYVVADTLQGLAVGSWSKDFGPFPPQKFPVTLNAPGNAGRFLKIEIFLQAGKNKLSPIVKSISAKGKSVTVQ